jgi:predicted peroxiredoxin
MAKVLYVGTAGSDDPTRAGFPFNFAKGALDAGHQAEIFLAGEAVYLLKDSIVDAINPKIFAEKVVAADKVVSI